MAPATACDRGRSQAKPVVLWRWTTLDHVGPRGAMRPGWLAQDRSRLLSYSFNPYRQAMSGNFLRPGTSCHDLFELLRGTISKTTVATNTRETDRTLLPCQTFFTNLDINDNGSNICNSNWLLCWQWPQFLILCCVYLLRFHTQKNTKRRHLWQGLRPHQSSWLRFSRTIGCRLFKKCGLFLRELVVILSPTALLKYESSLIINMDSTQKIIAWASAPWLLCTLLILCSSFCWSSHSVWKK